MGLKILVFTRKMTEKYTTFLSSIEKCMIYPSLEYIDFLKEAVDGDPVIIIAEEDGKIVGALPLMIHENQEKGKIINSLPWYGSIGSVVLRDESRNDIRTGLIEKYKEFMADEKVLASTIILSPDEQKLLDEYKKVLEPNYIDERNTQISELVSGEEDIEGRLLLSFKQKTRNLVRKSLKQQLELVVSDEDWAWKFLYETHVENLQAIGGKSKPWEHFEAMRKHIPADKRELSLALFDGKPVAGMLLFMHNITIEYITPVIKHDFRSMQPLSFLIFNAMKRQAENGMKLWNWGGTWASQKSLHHFKAGWGAADHPYSYVVNITREFEEKFKENPDKYLKIFPYFYIMPM